MDLGGLAASLTGEPYIPEKDPISKDKVENDG